MQIAVEPAAIPPERDRIFTASKVLELNKCSSVKDVNTATDCDTITDFLEAKNRRVKDKLFEMVQKL